MPGILPLLVLPVPPFSDPIISWVSVEAVLAEIAREPRSGSVVSTTERS